MEQFCLGNLALVHPVKKVKSPSFFILRMKKGALETKPPHHNECGGLPGGPAIKTLCFPYK